MPPVRRVYVCHVCSSVIMRVDTFRRHLANHASEESGWNCPAEECRRQFRLARKSELVKHMKFRHPTHEWAVDPTIIPEAQWIHFSAKRKYTNKRRSLIRTRMTKKFKTEMGIDTQSDDQVVENGGAEDSLQFITEGTNADDLETPMAIQVATIGATGTEELPRQVIIQASGDNVYTLVQDQTQALPSALEDSAHLPDHPYNQIIPGPSGHQLPDHHGDSLPDYHGDSDTLPDNHGDTLPDHHGNTLPAYHQNLPPNQPKRPLPSSRGKRRPSQRPGRQGNPLPLPNSLVNPITQWGQSLSPPNSFEGFDVIGGENSSTCRIIDEDTYEVKTVTSVIYRRRPQVSCFLH